MKLTKKKLIEILGVDDVRILSDGSYRAMNQYFYKHGRSEDDIVKTIKAKFPEARIIKTGDHYASFNGGDSVYKSSHLYAIFTLIN